MSSLGVNEFFSILLALGPASVYIYQVVSLFRSNLGGLAEDVRTQMGVNPAWRKWLARFKRLSGSLFSNPAAPGVTEAQTVLRAEMAGLGLDVPSAQSV